MTKPASCQSELETVARRSLDEVREAVTGYRRPTLAAELAIAQHSTATAGIACHIDAPAGYQVPEQVDALLAWTDRLPMWRIGLTGGLVGILCCVGPTVLALLGIVSAGTAFAWATNLYDNHAWWFRLGGLVVLVGLVWLSLRRRNQCSIAGIRRRQWRLLGAPTQIHLVVADVHLRVDDHLAHRTDALRVLHEHLIPILLPYRHAPPRLESVITLGLPQQ